MRRQYTKLAGALALSAASIFGQSVAQAESSVAFVTQQPANEWLARVLIGQLVHNTTGETVGNVNDLVLDHHGRISTVVIGVGGFLGMGEKNVGVSFDSFAFDVDSKGVRVITVAVSKEALMQAPAFEATEKTTFEKVKDKATDLGQRTVDEAVLLKDKAAQKIEDMRKDDTRKQ